MICGQFDLRAGCALPAERVQDRRAEVSRDLTRLIEASLIFTAPMQWDRHNAVDLLYQLSSALPHARSKRTRQRVPARILEGMNDLSQRPLVLSNRAGSRDRALTFAAARAMGLGIVRTGVAIRDWGLAPSGERVAAPVADRRRDWQNRAPAADAHTSRQRLVEERAAHGTTGRQHGRQ